MALCLQYSALSKKVKRELRIGLTTKPLQTQYDPTPYMRKCYEVNRKEDVMYIPLAQWDTLWDEFPSSRDEYPKTKVRFNGTLFTKETDPLGRGRDQDIVFKEAVSKLKEKHSCFIACYTGYGKSCTGICLSAYFKLKTAVICHSDIIKQQWKEEFERFTNAKVQIVKGKKPLDPKADVYIMGIQKSSTIPREWLEDIGLVIVDEAHICTETAFTNSLLRFQPMYVIGFSATPDRNDGLHKLLYMYFGPLQDFICRTETKDFTVTKYITKYKPKINYRMVMGKMTLDWSLVMSSLAENEDRQREIVKIAMNHPKEKIIILSSLQVQSNGIYDKLIEAGESAELLIGNKKKWDKSKRVLVAGTKKGGVGLNDPSLTMLILASSTKDVRQFEGRIRTTNNIIYDIVDDNKTLEKHWDIREDWYEERGATIVYEGCLPGSNTKSANSNGGLPLERFSGRK
jgi:hypothetical protein